MICKIDHIVITTAAPDACLDFYRKLGFDPQNAGGRYELFAGDFKINVHVQGAELTPHALRVQPGSADLCFALDEPLNTFCARLAEGGLSPLLGPVACTGVNGPMRSVYLRDPDGNLVEFCSYE